MRLLATIIFASTMLIAQQPAQDPSATGLQQLKVAAVNEVRALNTAEMRYRYDHGRFAGLDELKSSDEWQKTIGAMKNWGAGSPEFIAAYDTSLIAGAQGETYRISVKPKSDKCQQSSFFSDESGLIFEGKVIGCGSTATNGVQ